MQIHCPAGWAVHSSVLGCNYSTVAAVFSFVRGSTPWPFTEQFSKWSFIMLKLLRRKSFRKSKEFKPSSRTTLNSSSGSVSASGGSYNYLTSNNSSRPQRKYSRAVSSTPQAQSGQGDSQNSLDRKSIGSHRYSSVNLGSPVPAPELIQYTRPPENLTSPVRESLESGLRHPAPASTSETSKSKARRAIMNVISACPTGADETAARLRTGNIMPTARCLPPTPKRSSGHHSGRSSATSTSLPPTAQALPVCTQ